MTGPSAWMGVPPTATTTYVHTSLGPFFPATGTYPNFADASYLDKGTRTQWPGAVVGAYVDANGVANGPTPSQSAVGTAPINISGFPADLVITGGRVQTVTIDGVDVSSQCLWATGDNSSHILPNNSGTRVLVPRTTPGGSMVLTAVSGTPTWSVNRMANPTVSYLAFTDAPGVYRAPDIWSIDMTNDAALAAQSWWTRSSAAPPGTHSYSTDATLGINYLEAWVDASQNERVLPYYHYNVTPQEHLFVQWWYWIGGNVFQALATSGIKESGPGVHNLGAGDTTSIGATWEHSATSFSGDYPYPTNSLNTGIYGQWYYVQDQTTKVGNPRTNDPGEPSAGIAHAYKLPEHWYCQECEVWMNDVGSANGGMRMWLNGHLIYERTTIEWRADAASQWDSFHHQIYMGGLGHWLNSNAYFRCGPIKISTQYIGIPASML